MKPFVMRWPRSTVLTLDDIKKSFMKCGDTYEIAVY